jgi:hypothetical protein
MPLIAIAVVVFLVARRFSPARSRARAGSPDVLAEVGPLGWAAGTNWHVVRPLARADARRVLRHPAFVAGVLVTPLMLVAASSSDDTWRRLSGAIALALVPLGWLTIVAVNLLALRPRRTGADELFAALPAPQPVRSCGLLASAVVPVGAAAVLAGGWIVLLSTRDGFTGSPHWAEIAAGLLIVAGSVAVGVGTARWLPGAAFGVGAAIATMVIQARFFDVATWPWNRPESDPMRFLGFLAQVTSVGDGTLEIRPAGWHLVYLAGLIVVMVGVVLARDGGRPPVAILAAGLLVVATTGWVQTRPITASRAIELAAYLTEPADHQTCEEGTGVRYCAYPGFTDAITDWRERVEATLAFVPAATGPGRPSLQVIQRPAAIISTDSCSPTSFLTSLPARVADRLTPASLWPADGQVHPPYNSESFPCSERGVDGFFLAVQTGAWAVGLPPAPHDGNERCLAPGQARATVALWAGAAATPNGAAILRDVIADGAEDGTSLITFPDWDDPPMWGVDYAVVDAELALALLERPAADVRAVIGRDWATWIDPTTPSAQLAGAVGVSGDPLARRLPMTVSVADVSRRMRQVPALGPASVRVVTWTPMVGAMVAGTLFVALGSRAAVPMSLSVAGAGLAAAGGFLLDDPASVTLAASPTSRRSRALLRVSVAALGAGLGWAGAVAVATQRAGGLPLRGATLQLVALVATALAVSAVASSVGDRTAGGIAGAVVTIGCFASTFLPPKAWLPFPADPNGPGAKLRLIGVLGVALVVLFVGTGDPVRRRAGVSPGWRRGGRGSR